MSGFSHLTTFLAGAGVGAGLAFFLDPEQGGPRRSQARVQADRGLEKAKAAAPADVAEKAKAAQSGVADKAQQAKVAAGQARGKATGAVAKAKDAAPGSGGPDDATLAAKVETEIFRPADAPKGAVNVDVANGVVFLRGQLEDQTWIDKLGFDAAKVDGVKGVENLLHKPGEPAPTSRPGEAGVPGR